MFWQSAGQVGADTKLDLIVAPARFLSNSLRMWDPLSDSGTLQNQAYGYLFPMGAFFALGHLVHLPAWIVQRGWESLIVVAAFLGTFRLSGLLGLKRFWPRVAAGLAYALAPRMLSELGQISSELMPFAAAPWVLIPLVRGSRDGSPRRAAARSGVALLFAGGVNAAATAAILPLPVWWLVTRERGPRRAALARWWVLATALASLWWAIPLAVLGRYAPPFLNYIESSSVTTRQTTMATSLRGAEHWIGYLGPSFWPAAWSLVSSTPVVLGTAVVAAAGLAGMSRARARDRLFLSLSLVTGLVLVTLGHAGSVHPLAAGAWRRALDGSLDAFRNVHKFDPIVRLPLSIGVGWAMSGLADWLGVPRRRRLRLRAVTAQRAFAMLVVGCVTGLSVAPAFANQLIAHPRDTTDPIWWSQTANWLADHSDGGRALIVPAANTPYYLWGDPNDDAIQPYAHSPWATRNSIPLAQPGYIRLLDQIDAVLSDATADDALAPLLARSGIRYVVVRQDLDVAKSGGTPLPFIDTTLSDSPGFRLAQRFGPNLDAGAFNDLIDQGATTPGTVLIWQNLDWHSRVSLDPVAATVVANGSADNLPQLIADGLKPDQAVIFGRTPRALTGRGTPYRILDDGTRRREASFGSTQVYSGTMFTDQPYRLDRPSHDYLPSPAPALSTYRTIGIRSVTASSSGTDVDAFINRGPTDGPWNALDGSLQTAWRSGSFPGLVGQWLQVDLNHPISSPTAAIAVTGVAGDLPSQVVVSTSSGSVVDDLTPTYRRQPLATPDGPAAWIRVTVRQTSDRRPGFGAGIADLEITGVHPARTLVVPSTGTPQGIGFGVEAGNRPACLTVGGVAACDGSWLTYGEEAALDRSFTTATTQSYRAGGQVELHGGAALNRALAAGDPLTARASSTDSTDPREQAGAAVDGDPRTGWVAAAGDPTPTLHIRSRRHRLTAIRLRPVPGAAVTQPHEVTVTAGSARVTAFVPPDGIIRLPAAVRAAAVTLTIDESGIRSSTSSINGSTKLLPVGIGEVELLGPKRAWHGTARRSLAVPCGHGPVMTIDGHHLPTSLTASRTAALAGLPVGLRACGAASRTGRIRLPAGSHRIVLLPNALTTPVTASLTAAPLPAAASPGRVGVVRWLSTSRAVRVSTSRSALLVVPENVNAGWQATLDGHHLPAVTVDGWQQGWVLPGHAAGVVSMRFTPQTAVTAGLVGGGVAALVLVAAAVVPSRPRRRTARAGAARPGYRTVAALVLLSGLLLGSLPGLAVAVGVLIVDRGLRRDHHGRIRATAVAVTLAAVAVAVALRPATDVLPASPSQPLAGNAVVQLVCIFAVALTLLGSGAGSRAAAPQSDQSKPTRSRRARRRRAGPPGD